MKFFEDCKKLSAVTFFQFFPLFLLDFFSKMGVIFWMFPGQEIPIFSHFFGIRFSLNYVVNTGAAWGLFSSQPQFLLMVRILIIAFMIRYLISSQTKDKKTGALWLIVIGAIGNVIDYVLHGHVVDFLHFSFWGYSFAVFNFADSYITMAVLFMILSSFRSKKNQTTDSYE